MQFARGGEGKGGEEECAAEISERKTWGPDLTHTPEQLRINLARGRGHSNECLTLMGFAGPVAIFAGRIKALAGYRAG